MKVEFNFLKSPFVEDAPGAWFAYCGLACISEIRKLKQPKANGRLYQAIGYERNDDGEVICEFLKSSPTFEWAELWATQHAEDLFNSSLGEYYRSLI